MTTINLLGATVLRYCDSCNAPRVDKWQIFMRCGTCAVRNGKFPPTKYQPIGEVPTVEHLPADDTEGGAL